MFGRMSTSDLFTAVFAAVLCANILTAMLVYGMIAYSRLERDGRAGEVKRTIYICIFMPLVFCLGFTMIALDKVPAWLDRISQ
jgi:hypothetical protein